MRVSLIVIAILCMTICYARIPFAEEQYRIRAELLYQKAQSPKEIYAAIEAYDQVIDLNSSYANSYLKIGNLYCRLLPFDRKAYDKAIYYYNKYAELNPDDIEVIINFKKELDKRKNVGFFNRVFFYLNSFFQSIAYY